MGYILPNTELKRQTMLGKDNDYSGEKNMTVLFDIKEFITLIS